MQGEQLISASGKYVHPKYAGGNDVTSSTISRNLLADALEENFMDALHDLFLRQKGINTQNLFPNA